MIKHNIYPLALKKINNFLIIFFYLLCCVQFPSCFTAGTHGSLYAYSFPVPKHVLQQAVAAVISQNSNIKIAPITDTFTSKYYNDGVTYVTIQIENDHKINEITFQYSGSKIDWDTAKNTEISIAYVIDENGNGGSENRKNISSDRIDLVLQMFKIQFIDRINLQIKKDKAHDHV